jgi:hypothetical protein
VADIQIVTKMTGVGEAMMAGGMAVGAAGMEMKAGTQVNGETYTGAIMRRTSCSAHRRAPLL